MRFTRFIATAATILIFGLSFSASALCVPQEATSGGELQLGVQAYKNAHYDEAIRHFQKAVELDTGNINAHLYLATTYAQKYIPSVEIPENQALAEKAIEQYSNVLDLDSTQTQKINSDKGIAYLFMNMKKFDDAKKYYHAALDLDPNDAASSYSIGVIDWTEVYQPRMEARAQLGMRPEEHLDAANRDQKALCDELKEKNSALIDDGIETLKDAIDARPDYDDAMAYLNLMYREKADLDCDDPARRKQDLMEADEWVDKVLAIKNAKAEKEKKADAKAQNPSTKQ